MSFSVLLLLASLYLLYKGSDWVVKYSSSLAKHYGVTTLVISLTIVAFGTSMPEVITTFIAAVQEDFGVAMGNIIGTNIANFALVLGLSAVVRPLKVETKTLRREIPFAAAAVLLVWWFASNGVISFFEGVILLILSVTFTVYMLYVAQKERVFDEAVAHVTGKLFGRVSGKNLFFILLGLAALVLGAKLLVDSAVDIAITLGIDPFIIAVTVVAVGTSVPELAASLVASIKNQGDIVLGNIVGSNILNILVGLGLSAVFIPVIVSEHIRSIDIPLMVGITFLVWLMMRTGHKLTRTEGLILLIFYGIYMYITVN